MANKCAGTISQIKKKYEKQGLEVIIGFNNLANTCGISREKMRKIYAQRINNFPLAIEILGELATYVFLKQDVIAWLLSNNPQDIQPYWGVEKVNTPPKKIDSQLANLFLISKKGLKKNTTGLEILSHVGYGSYL